MPDDTAADLYVHTYTGKPDPAPPPREWLELITPDDFWALCRDNELFGIWAIEQVTDATGVHVRRVPISELHFDRQMQTYSHSHSHSRKVPR